MDEAASSLGRIRWKQLLMFCTKHEPPRWGGYVTLKLCQSSMVRDTGADLAQLESQSQLGSAAKAAISLERFCPTLSMAPVWAIV
jgi:hypothetical protein